MGQWRNWVLSPAAESAHDLEPCFGTLSRVERHRSRCGAHASENASPAKSRRAWISTNKDFGHLCFCPMSKRKSLGVDLFVCFPFQSVFWSFMASALQILNMMTHFPSKQVNKLSNDSLGLVCHYSGHGTVITKDRTCSAKLQNEGRGVQTGVANS